LTQCREIHFTKATIKIDTAVDIALEEMVPDILCSAFVDDCIERGKTIKEGGSVYDFISGLQVGIANLGNSLAAIKKLVFEEGTISRESLMKNLKNNFEGEEGEKVRQLPPTDERHSPLLQKEAHLPQELIPLGPPPSSSRYLSSLQIRSLAEV